MSGAKRGSRFLPSVLGVVMAVALALAFYLGRRTASGGAAPGGTEVTVPGEGAGHGASEPEEGHGEAEVIRFDEEALRLANLTVEPVALRSLQSRLPLTGTVEPNAGGVVKITPRVSGKITTVRVNVGDNVPAGAALATLASTELAEAQARYQEAGVQVRAASSNLQRQQRLAGIGEFGRHKVEEARAASLTVQGKADEVRTELTEARNQVAEARSEKAAAEGEVAAAESAVASARSAEASMESEVGEAEAQVRALRAALAQAQNRVKVALSKFNRYDTLLKEELVSRQDWEQAQADHLQALSDVDAAQANIGQALSKVQAAKARKDAAAAQVRTAQAKVRAEQNRVQQVEAKIETAVAHQAQIAAQVETAERQARIAEQVLAREERIYRGGFLTSKEIVEAEAALRTANGQRLAASNTVRLLGGVPGGGSTITITAPIAGRVTERGVTLGETVTPEKALFTVVNLNTVWVQLEVRQQDLPRVRTGQSVTVTSSTAPGRTFRGSVAYIGDVVDETTRTVKVRAVIQNLNNVLKPQTFVRGTIGTDAQTQVLAVPQEAVQSLEGKTVVFVQGDHPGEFTAKEVETGETVAGQAVILSGLEPGAQVVTKGAFTVKAQAQKAELGHEH